MSLAEAADLAEKPGRRGIKATIAVPEKRKRFAGIFG